MTPKTDNTVLQSVMEVLSGQGIEAMQEIAQTLLNETMKAERAEAIGAEPYERTSERKGFANGYKPKTIKSRIGELKVQVPQARGLSFYPKSLEKGCRSERALKAAIAEMYIQGVSTRRVADITEKLCGFEISATQVSRITKELDKEINAFCNRPLACYPFIMLDARYEKIRYSGYVRDCSVLIALGISDKGKREVLGFSVSLSEAEVHWMDFLESLVKRGLRGVRMVTSDEHKGLTAAHNKVFPYAFRQRCQFHFAQNAQHHAPKKALKQPIAKALRRIFDSGSVEDARLAVLQVIKEFETSAPDFVTWLEENVEQCFSVYAFPAQFRIYLRTVNLLENVNRQIKRRTRIACIFPNTASCVRLIGALLIETHEDWIYDNRYRLNMDLLIEDSDSDKQIYRKDVA